MVFNCSLLQPMTNLLMEVYMTEITGSFVLPASTRNFTGLTVSLNYPLQFETSSHHFAISAIAYTSRLLYTNNTVTLKEKHSLKVCPHRASALAAAAVANTKSMEASTQASSGTFEVCRLPLGVG